MNNVSVWTTRHYLHAAVVALLVILGTLTFVTRRSASLTQKYRNDTYRFSLSLPTDYAVTEVPSANQPELNAIVDTIEFGNSHGNVQPGQYSMGTLF